MKKTSNRPPTRSTFTILRQLCNLIPTHLVPKLACESCAKSSDATWLQGVKLDAPPGHDLGFGSDRRETPLEAGAE